MNPFLPPILLLFLLAYTTSTTLVSDEHYATNSAIASVGSGRGRSLLEFKETKRNTSFQCSPSGPCIPCTYSEKKDKKYRCSETGYRVPLKCVLFQHSSKEKVEDKKQRKLHSTNEQLATAVKGLKWRRLLGKPSASEDVKQSYITYRSCVAVDGEERLSLLGFEMVMVGLLLISGPVAYMRQRRSLAMPGAVRIPSTSPRF